MSGLGDSCDRGWGMHENEMQDTPFAAEEPTEGSLTEPRSVPWDKTLESWNPLVVLMLAVAGAVGAFLLIWLGSSSTARSQQFVNSSAFIVWAAVIAVQGGFWAVVTVPLWREVVSTYRESGPRRRILLIPGAVILLIAGLVIFSPARAFDWPLAGHNVRVWILTAAAALSVGVPAVFGICLVQDRVRRHKPGSLHTSDILMAVNARAQIKRFLGLAGAAIGLVVLASGALQRAVVPLFFSAAVFPASSVLLYGAFFTAILVVVYVPAHLSLRRLCADLREMWFPMAGMPDPTSADFASWLQGRDQLDAFTQFNLTVSQQLQAAIFVLTPLLSGILGALIPKAT